MNDEKPVPSHMFVVALAWAEQLDLFTLELYPCRDFKEVESAKIEATSRAARRGAGEIGPLGPPGKN